MSNINVHNEPNPIQGPGPSAIPDTESLLTQAGSLLKELTSSKGTAKATESATQAVDKVITEETQSPGSLSPATGQAATVMGATKLPPPNPGLQKAFTTMVQSLPIGSQEKFIVGSHEKNAFLDASATLDLFKMTCKITSELASIQLAENKLRIEQLKATLDAAKSTAEAIVASGDLAAAQEQLQSAAAYAEASAMIAGAVVSSACTLMSKAGAIAVYKRSLAESPDKGEGAMKLASMKAEQFSSLVDTAGRAADTGAQVASKTIEGGLHASLATITKDKARLDAAAKVLEQYSSVLSKNADALGQAANELSSSIKDILDMYKRYAEAVGQMWHA